ncbi:DUF1834 family protein [Dyella lutea]|uniref:DUF1834 family protein n=1 Tax=Dyella lutea TaxID=2950441 RepID=A0ABT1FDE1_9GAMM|nr:DUF1834 family protein [Dyella lutea]MCP1375389.1 DUF1834 family protein [Dyella lutea]
MSLLDVRTAIVDTIKAALPASTMVEAHRGRFDSVEELKRFATRAPAVLVALLRAPLNDATEAMPRIPAGWAVFVVTRDIPQLARDAGAIALVEKLQLLISGNTWGRDDTSAPVSIDASNLYSDRIDNLGVALWGISFEQTISNPVLDQAALDALGLFETFHQDIDVAPADGQIDITETDTLPQ